MEGSIGKAVSSTLRACGDIDQPITTGLLVDGLLTTRPGRFIPSLHGIR